MQAYPRTVLNWSSFGLVNQMNCLSALKGTHAACEQFTKDYLATDIYAQNCQLSTFPRGKYFLKLLACSLVGFWADKPGWCWFIVREKHCWLTDKPWLKSTSEQVVCSNTIIFYSNYTTTMEEHISFFSKKEEANFTFDKIFKKLYL